MYKVNHISNVYISLNIETHTTFKVGIECLIALLSSTNQPKCQQALEHVIHRDAPPGRTCQAERLGACSECHCYGTRNDGLRAKFCMDRRNKVRWTQQHSAGRCALNHGGSMKCCPSVANQDPGCCSTGQPTSCRVDGLARRCGAPAHSYLALHKGGGGLHAACGARPAIPPRRPGHV